MQAKCAFQKGNMSLEEFRRKYPAQWKTVYIPLLQKPEGSRSGRFIDRRDRPFRFVLPAL